MFIRRVPLLALASALSLAACDRDPATTYLPSLTAVSGPPAALTWQAKTRELIAANRYGAPAAGRLLAAVSVAQYRAVQSVGVINPEHHPAGDGIGAGGRAQYEAHRGAVAAASAKVLAFFFPGVAGDLNGLVEQMAGRPVHPQFARGAALGRHAANEVITHVSTDGFTAPWTGSAPQGADKWKPLATPPVGVMLGSVKPYFLTSGAQFRPAAPPAYLGAEFMQDLNAVKTFALNATPAQIAIAKSWDYSAGTFTPIGYWNAKAAAFIAEQNLGDAEAARIFSAMHASVFDAMIGCWDAKYHYWTVRPYDVEQFPLVLSKPNHPSYPSGHSCVSASAARVLEHFFPEHTSELNALVTEAGMSRVYAGIHFLFDVSAGQALGRAVADWVLAR